MAATKFNSFLTLDGADRRLQEAIITSAGVADAGKIAQTDATGRFDLSLMPVGVVPDTKILETSEALAAGDLVNIFLDSGVAKARKADSTNGRRAHGFVLAGFALAANATVYLDSMNTQKSGLTIGAQYFLTSAGGIMTTAPAAPTDSIYQYVGFAVSATELVVELDQPILLV